MLIINLIHIYRIMCCLINERECFIRFKATSGASGFRPNKTRPASLFGTASNTTTNSIDILSY
jgi:hypothetical protein